VSSGVFIEVPTLLVILALSAILAVSLYVWVNSRFRRAVLKRRFRHAVDAEAQAPQLLRKHGYEILGAQVVGGYTLGVDGSPINVPLRADYLVKRENFCFLVEVKSGNVAPKLTTASTRRQLLEYVIAFQVDGILLLDAESQRLHQIVFPLAQTEKPSPTIHLYLAIILMFTFIAAAIYITHVG
jgi:hypothetical protein